MMALGERYCVRCGQKLSWDAKVCPYCGYSYRYEQDSRESSPRNKVILYAISVMVPLAGILIGISLLGRQDEDSRHTGRICLLIGIMPILVALLCWVAIASAWLTFF